MSTEVAQTIAAQHGLDFEKIMALANFILLCVGLFLVLRQIRDAKSAVNSNTYQSIIAQEQELFRLFYGYPDSVSLTKEIQSLNLSPEEWQGNEYRDAMAVFMMIDTFENLFVQHDRKAIPDDNFDHWKEYMKDVARGQKFRKRWNRMDKKIFYRPFQQFMDNITE